MPNLVDIVEVAEALESKAVYLASDRCVVVRNRHASCAKCADACPTGSVFAANNVLELDGEGCVACGACTTVCPVEALIPLRPLDEDLASSVASAVAATGGKAVFACARIASKRLADPAKYAEVPCLARMEESVLLGLAARGVEDIVLVDGTCATCKFRSNVPGIDATVASANELMAAQGSDVCVRRASAFPDEVLLEDKRTLLGESRRGFFTSARTRAKDAAGKTAEVMVFKNDNAAPSLREPAAHVRRWHAAAVQPAATHAGAGCDGPVGRADGSRDRHAAVRLGIHRHAGVQLVQHVHGVLPDGRAAQKRAGA